MVVMILEKVSPSLRGEMTKWMLEPFPGTFVGNLSAMVRDRLWERICRAVVGKWRGAATMVEPADTEQGFRITTFGPTRRDVVDCEGLQLIRLPHPKNTEPEQEASKSIWQWQEDADAWSRCFQNLLKPEVDLGVEELEPCVLFAWETDAPLWTRYFTQLCCQ